MIILKNVSKQFNIGSRKSKSILEMIKFTASKKKFFAVKNVNLTINDKEKVAIIGPNGSGKSTLLSIICNILEPTSGVLQIDEEVTPVLQLGAGFKDELSVKDNIYLYGAIFGMTRNNIRKRLSHILDFAEIRGFEDAKLKELSTGMKSKVAFSVAIHSNPKVLILDEVFAVGDLRFTNKCIKILGRIKNFNGSIILVTHNFDIVSKYFDRCIYLNKGKIISDGKPADVIKKYVYETKK